MEKGTILREPILRLVLGGLCIFFLLFSSLAFSFFLLGNYQAFISRTQFLILDILKYSSLFGLLSGIQYLVYLGVSFLKKLPVGTGRVFLGIVTTGSGGFFLVAVHFVLVVTQPVR